MKIFTVNAAFEHDGSSPLVAFKNEQAAKDYAEECNVYHKTEEPCSMTMSDSQLLAYGDRHDIWAAGHPANKYNGAYADFYKVAELEIADAAPNVTNEMVNRFLSWKLPEDFCPDGYVAFNKELADENQWPVGTNLLTATQVMEMLEHVLTAPPTTLLQGE